MGSPQAPESPLAQTLAGGAILGALAALIAVAPAVGAGAVVGDPLGEALGHLWGLAVASDGLLSHGPYVRTAAVGWPSAWQADLVDPANLLVFAPLYAILGQSGLAAAWALTLTAWLLAGGMGAALLGHRLGLGRTGAWVVAAAWVLSPALHGALIPAGRSEYWPWLLWPLHLALLHKTLHTRHLGVALAAAGALAVVAHGGWPGLLLLLPVQVAMALWLLPRGRASVGWLVGVGVGAAVLCVPMLLVHLSLEPWWTGRLERPSPFDNAPLGVVLTGLWTGVPPVSVGDAGPALSPVLAVAALAGARRRWGLVLLGAAVLLVSLGPVVWIGGVRCWAPAAVLAHVVPLLRGIHGWTRLAHLAVLPLALVAGTVLRGRERWALAFGIGLLINVFVDRALAPPRSVPLPAPAQAPAAPVLDLVPRDAGDPEQAARQQALVDRVLLSRWRAGQATTLVPSTPDPDPVLAVSLLARRMGGPAGLDACVGDEAARLWAAGVRSVVLHPDAAPAFVQQRRGHVQSTARVLGTAGTPVGDTHTWVLADPGAPEQCPTLPALPRAEAAAERP